MLECVVDLFCGAALRGEPELSHKATSSVRAVVVEQIPIAAKMWLDIANTSQTLDCAESMIGREAVSELLAA